MNTVPHLHADPGGLQSNWLDESSHHGHVFSSRTNEGLMDSWHLLLPVYAHRHQLPFIEWTSIFRLDIVNKILL